MTKPFADGFMMFIDDNIVNTKILTPGKRTINRLWTMVFVKAYKRPEKERKNVVFKVNGSREGLADVKRQGCHPNRLTLILILTL
jgi:hypothetical protein